MDTNLREEKERFTTETQRPRSETFREGSRSLLVLCVSVVNFVFIRVHSCLSDEALSSALLFARALAKSDSFRGCFYPRISVFIRG